MHSSKGVSNDCANRPHLGGKNVESWDAMLELKAQGKAKAVGVSNFGVSHLQGLKDAGRELPYDRSLLAWPFVHASGFW